MSSPPCTYEHTHTHTHFYTQSFCTIQLDAVWVGTNLPRVWCNRSPHGSEEWQGISITDWLYRNAGDNILGGISADLFNTCVQVRTGGVTIAKGCKLDGTSLYSGLWPPGAFRVDRSLGGTVVNGITAQKLKTHERDLYEQCSPAARIVRVLNIGRAMCNHNPKTN